MREEAAQAARERERHEVREEVLVCERRDETRGAEIENMLSRCATCEAE